MRIKRVNYHVKGLVNLADYALRLAHMISDKAKQRVKILAFWERHGLKATLDAFPVRRSSLFSWKRKLKQEKGRLEALNDASRAPGKRRKRLWPQGVIDEIKRLRARYPNLGKDKVCPLLSEFCDEKGLRCPKISTIGRLIKDCGGLCVFPQTIYHNGKIKPIKRAKILRKPKAFIAEYPGHLVALDTIEKFVQGCRRYVITFEDVYSRFSFAWSTKSHASLAAKEFFNYCQMVFPHPFSFVNVLTDNGSEFKKHFTGALSELHLTHYHTYPKTPKMNAHCERFNRTIQEEYVDYHMQELLNPLQFNEGLIEWLLWYNTKRPHYAFQNKQSPLQFMMSLTPQKSNLGWTHTNT
jgi:transposase InsO family protein